MWLDGFETRKVDFIGSDIEVPLDLGQTRLFCPRPQAASMLDQVKLTCLAFGLPSCKALI